MRWGEWSGGISTEGIASQRFTALLIAVFALQDSFGTACNVTGDGAMQPAYSGVSSLLSL